MCGVALAAHAADPAFSKEIGIDPQKALPDKVARTFGEMSDEPDLWSVGAGRDGTSACVCVNEAF